jgi:hypothetical protein
VLKEAVYRSALAYVWEALTVCDRTASRIYEVIYEAMRSDTFSHILLSHTVSAS